MNRIPASCLCLALALGLLGGCARAPVASNPAPAPASDETTPQPAPPQPAVPAVSDTACVAPRTKMCTTEYNPVCATKDTGIRCITTPCPSSERKTFSSACAACVDPGVSGWTKGACPGGGTHCDCVVPFRRTLQDSHAHDDPLPRHRDSPQRSGCREHWAPSLMRVLLARHGETPWNAEGRYQGQRDIPLSPVGEAQARALGERLRKVEVMRAVASPLSRAVRTAQLALGADRASMLTFDPGLQEIAHGDWEGLLASEIAIGHPELLRAWRESPESVLMPGEGGESLQQVLDRAWPAFERACAGLGPQDLLLVVAHDAVNRVLLCRILGLPLSRLWSFRQAPTTLNLLEGASADALELVRLNDCQHHTALFGEAVHRAL